MQIHIALVPEAADVELPELVRVSAALEQQVTRDLLAAWGLSATVDTFASLDDVPIGFWPVLLNHEQARALRALLAGAVSQEYAWVEALEVEELRVSSLPPPLSAAPAREVPEVASLTPATRNGPPEGQRSRVTEAWFGALGLLLASAVGWMVLVSGRGTPVSVAAAAPAQAVLALDRSASPALASLPAEAAPPPASPAPVSPAPVQVDAVVVADASAHRVATHRLRAERARHRARAAAPNLPTAASAPSEPPAAPIEVATAAVPAAAPAAAPQGPPMTASFDSLIESRR